MKKLTKKDRIFIHNILLWICEESETEDSLAQAIAYATKYTKEDFHDWMAKFKIL